MGLGGWVRRIACELEMNGPLQAGRVLFAGANPKNIFRYQFDRWIHRKLLEAEWSSLTDVNKDTNCVIIDLMHRLVSQFNPCRPSD